MSLRNAIHKLNDARAPYCSCVIAAAGSSQRMGGVNKIFTQLGNHPVLYYALIAMEQSLLVREIIVATQETTLEKVSDICAQCHITKPLKVIVGGNTRLESVYRAALECNSRAEFIAVHDGARPLVLPSDVDNIIRSAFKTNASAPAVPVSDTIKVANDQGLVLNTPNRKELFAVQTPQVFQSNLLCAALKNAIDQKADVTDDCSAVELLGKKVYLVSGNPENMKLTRPSDFAIAEVILKKRKGQ